ncbi:MAG: tetratricopeptide repeat protein, partial [bacterium]
TALSALERAERADPRGFEPRLMRATWLTVCGRLREAANSLDVLERERPADLDLWLERARLAEARGRIGEARRILRRVLSLYPHDAVAKEWLARISPAASR